jgi:hypothetical protein
MGRSMSRTLCLVGGLLVAGCADHGTYNFAWTFADQAPSTGCGQHGVSAIRVTGSNTGGDREDVTTLCANGWFTHSVPVGAWTLTVRQVDVRGRAILVLDDQGYALPDPTGTANVTTNADTPLYPSPITLAARPACSDGVDNEPEPDGRVDLDDPECGGLPGGLAE